MAYTNCLTRLCTVKDAQAQLRLGRTTIYKLIRRGQLDAVRIGTRRLVVVGSIDKLIERSRPGDNLQHVSANQTGE